MVAHAWLVTALNPKSLTFFVAFLPQFVDRHADFWTQMLVFEATFLALAFANAFGLRAGRGPGPQRGRQSHTIRIFNRTGGTCWSAPASRPWRCARAIERRLGSG